MIRVAPPRGVVTTVQCFHPINPTLVCRGSEPAVVDCAVSVGRSHSSWAVTKSMPCLARFAALLAGSYSNRMADLITPGEKWYKKSTLPRRGSPPGGVAVCRGVSPNPTLRRCVSFTASPVMRRTRRAENPGAGQDWKHRKRKTVWPLSNRFSPPSP